MEQLIFIADADDRAQRRVLIVEPEPQLPGRAGAAHRSTPAIAWRPPDSARAAFAEIYRMPPDALVSELTMPGTSGVELARMIREDAVHHDFR